MDERRILAFERHLHTLFFVLTMILVAGAVYSIFDGEGWQNNLMWYTIGLYWSEKLVWRKKLMNVISRQEEALDEKEKKES